MKKFFKSRKFIAILVIAFSILSEVILTLFFRDKSSSFLETFYYSTQIISSMFVVGGVVIAVWQYYLSSKSARDELEIKQVQRAIDLSEYYKDNILKYVPAITYIFNESGITPILSKLKFSQLKTFDKAELEDLLSSEDIKTLKNSQYDKLFYNAVITANDMYNLRMKFVTTTIKQDHNGKEIETIAVNNASIVISFFADLLNNILNNMEFFALHFSHNTADESVVYQSLHQSYFELVRLTYYYIAVQNDNPSYKYYTNVIDLFHKWMNAKNEQKNALSEKANSVQRSGTKIEK